MAKFFLCMTVWSLVLAAAPVVGALLEAGDAAPDIAAEAWINTEGPVSLRDDTNAVFVIEFWATWCGPCKFSIPHLNRLHQRLRARNVRVIGLSDESEDTVRAFMKDMPMRYAVGVGTSSGTDYGVRGIPAAFVVKRHEILWSGHPMQGLEMAVERALGDPFEPDSAAAVVGDLPISIVDYRTFVSAAMGDANLEHAPEVSKYRLLDLMIQQMQLKERLAAAGLSVSDKEVKTRQAREKAEYEAMLENKGKTFESFLQENGVSLFLRLEMVRIDLATERLAARAFDDSAVKRGYDENPTQHHRAHVRHIMLKVPDWSDSKAVEAARNRLGAIRDKIIAGKAFSDLAILHSDGRRASRGGDWGWLGKGGQTSIDTAMFELPVGGLSGVLSSRAGFHLIKVIARKDTFESLEADLRQEFLHERKIDILKTLGEDATVRRNPYL